MKYMIRKLDSYNSNRDKDKIQRTSSLLNATKFYKERKMILIAFENGIFSLLFEHPSSMDDWEEDDMDSLEFLSLVKRT